MDRLKHRIVVTDFQKVNGTMRGFIFGIYNNPSVVSGKNENDMTVISISRHDLWHQKKLDQEQFLI